MKISPVLYHHNLLYLHARRQLFRTYNEIAPAILAHWPENSTRCVNEFLQLLGHHWSGTEVEAAVWKMVGDAAAEGRLLVDLTEEELSRSTPLALLSQGVVPILPSRSLRLLRSLSRFRQHCMDLLQSAMRVRLRNSRPFLGQLLTLLC